jgi:hypothetical protein
VNVLQKRSDENARKKRENKVYFARKWKKIRRYRD